MTVKVNITSIYKQYNKSHRELNCMAPFISFKSFATLYEKEYNVKIVRQYLIFQSEADYTWFLMRWS